MASQTFVPALFLFPFFTVIFKNVTLVDWLSCTWLPKVGTFSLFEKFNSVQTELAVFSLAKCDGFKKKLLSLTLCGFFLSHYACTSELYSIFLTLWFFIRLAGYFSESPICDSAVSGNLDELALPNFFSFARDLETNYPEQFKLSS